MSDIREKLMEVIANRTAPNAADAILASFYVAPRGEGDAVCDKAVTPVTAYRVARWRHMRWIELHPAHPTDVYLRPEGGTGAHALYARCRDCAEALLPETFEPVPPDAAALPSVEAVNFTEVANLAQEMLGKGVWPDTARAVFEAVLALYPGRTEAEVRQDEAERIAAWVTADEPSDTLVLLADALRRGDHRG